MSSSIKGNRLLDLSSIISYWYLASALIVILLSLITFIEDKSTLPSRIPILIYTGFSLIPLLGISFLLFKKNTIAYILHGILMIFQFLAWLFILLVFGYIIFSDSPSLYDPSTDSLSDKFTVLFFISVPFFLSLAFACITFSQATMANFYGQVIKDKQLLLKLGVSSMYLAQLAFSISYTLVFLGDFLEPKANTNGIHIIILECLSIFLGLIGFLCFMLQKNIGRYFFITGLIINGIITLAQFIQKQQLAQIDYERDLVFFTLVLLILGGVLGIHMCNPSVKKLYTNSSNNGSSDYILDSELLENK